MKYGYARISTAHQSIDRQIRNIEEYLKGDKAVIMQEVFTGTKSDRPVFTKLLKKVKAGDTIVFDEVSRMARNAEEGFSIYQDLMQRGVDLVFLKEHQIDTATYKAASSNGLSMTGTDVDCILKGINEYMMRLAANQIQIAFAQAQAEVDHLHQRTKEGIETARINGKQIGQVTGKKLEVKKAAPAKELIRKHCKEFGGKLSDAEVMKLAGIARNTFYKYKAEVRAEG